MYVFDEVLIEVDVGIVKVYVFIDCLWRQLSESCGCRVMVLYNQLNFCFCVCSYGGLKIFIFWYFNLLLLNIYFVFFVVVLDCLYVFNFELQFW